MNTKLLGRWGEGKAADYLRKKGYSVVGISYQTRFGEIDIIAENKDFLVFAEVKLRKNHSFAEAKEFVGYHKQKRLISSAKVYLASHETAKQPRFDVIEIYASDGIQTVSSKIIHTENAFMEL